jgi:hypothetical protein
MKKCKRCQIEKNIEEFIIDVRRKKDGRGSYCSDCEKERLKEYYEKNRERIIERQKNYTKENFETVAEYLKEYGKKNREKLSNYIREYRELNREELNAKSLERKNSNIIRKLSSIVRGRIYVYLKSKNMKKKSKTFEMVGCSPEELKVYLENLFTEGMDWSLIGSDIHIDHIVPLSSSKSEEELFGLCHYTNLQPLWKTTREINGKIYLGNLNKSNNEQIKPENSNN